MPTDQPRDRGICGDAAPLLTPSIFGGHCDLLAGHTGWHEVDGMHWGPNEPAPWTSSWAPTVDDLTPMSPTQADVDAAYQRGLTDGKQHGRTQAADAAESAMRAESDRLAAPGDARAVEQGIGVAHAMNAVRRAIVGPWEPADPEPRGEAADGGERPAEAAVAGAAGVSCRTEVVYMTKAGWCWRCHTHDVSRFNLAEERARTEASEHEESSRDRS